MTATPLKEEIVQQIVALVRTVTVANGYSQTVKTVTRDAFNLEFDLQLAPIIYVEDLEEEMEHQPSGVVEARLIVSIVGGLLPKNQQPQTLASLSTALNIFEADVKTLFLVNDTNRTLGNRAVDLKFRRAAKDVGYLLNGRGCFALEMEVLYRYRAHDPSLPG